VDGFTVVLGVAVGEEVEVVFEQPMIVAMHTRITNNINTLFIL
jgi:hypothetical protein